MMKNIGTIYDAEQDDLKISVQRDGNGLITSGLMIGDVTKQNQAFLLASNKGEYKLEPLVGVGIVNYINGTDLLEATQEIRDQFEADGQVIEQLDVKTEEINIYAYYK